MNTRSSNQTQAFFLWFCCPKVGVRSTIPRVAVGKEHRTAEVNTMFVFIFKHDDLKLPKMKRWCGARACSRFLPLKANLSQNNLRFFLTGEAEIQPGELTSPSQDTHTHTIQSQWGFYCHHKVITEILKPALTVPELSGRLLFKFMLQSLDPESVDTHG